jgi:hypothetical protein
VRGILLSARGAKPAFGRGETPLRSGERARPALTAPRLSGSRGRQEGRGCVPPRSGRPWRGRPECLIRRYKAPIGALSRSLDRTFFALSDPTRRGILERLGRGPATIGELAEPFGPTINGVKKHVGILEEVDLTGAWDLPERGLCSVGER